MFGKPAFCQAIESFMTGSASAKGKKIGIKNIK
jgi:hypothetical protein